MAHHSGDEDERGDPSDALPPSPELRAPSDSESSAFGNAAPVPSRLADDPSRELSRSYLDTDRIAHDGEQPPQLSPRSAALPSPPPPPADDDARFYNDREAWQRREKEDQEEARRHAAQQAEAATATQHSSWAQASVQWAQKEATETGAAVLSYTARGVREGVRMHQRGECTLELGCTALATMIFLWFLFWLFRHLHWTLQWLVVACMVLWALSIAGYAVDVDRLCLEPLHNEFPDLARMLARARDRCSSALRRTGFGGGWRRGSMGGEFSATGQFYEEGEEDAPLLARSGEVNAIDVERGLADVDFDYADAPAAARREIERLRSANLTASQRTAELQAENERYRAAAAAAAMPGTHEEL